jgi:hypothetical protein
MALSLASPRRVIGHAVNRGVRRPSTNSLVKRRALLSATVIVTLALGLTSASAIGAGGRLQLTLVNSGPQAEFYPVKPATHAHCIPSFLKPASLSTRSGTGVQLDSPGYAFGSEAPSRFSYTVPAGSGFTVPASTDAVVLKLWAFSGDGTCDGQLGDQTIDWRVLCSGTCGSDVSLTGPGQTGPKAGWQTFGVPAGTPLNTLANNHAGPSSRVAVSAGDVITLEVSADTWAGIQWSAPNGAGASSLMILRS